MDPLADLTPLEGGWSGETFLAEAAGERSVVRIYADPRHHPRAAEITEAVLRLVRGLVPVPAVLEVRHADPAADTPALLVTEYVEGTRGDALLPRLDRAGLRRAGEECGRLAATLAGMPFLTAGTFADGALRVEPSDLHLPRWLADHRAHLGLSEAELAGLETVAEEGQGLLDTVHRVSLVHSDLNPKNLVLDPDSLQVRAVLDWEYAHAGTPFVDLGNLLRFDRDEEYVAGVLGGYTALRGGGRAETLELARTADLVALIELAARAGENPVADRARDHLTAIARTGDVHALPG